MPVPTTQELLDATEEAILALLQRGQEVRVNGRTYRRADLPELRAFRDALKTEISRNARGGIRMRQAVPRG